MRRIKFSKGKQRNFLKIVLEKINCPSLRELIRRGFDINYSTLKNYYNESRLLPEELFISLCEVGKINSALLNVKYIEGNFGQVKGGKISRK